jgi:hypothetical protein
LQTVSNLLDGPYFGPVFEMLRPFVGGFIEITSQRKCRRECAGRAIVTRICRSGATQMSYRFSGPS